MSTLGAVPSAAASLLSTSQIAPGKPFLLRCHISDQGEYHHRCTDACSARISGYIEEYEVFKAKGIEGTYVVARNDHATGLIFDATPLLAAPRSKRMTYITNVTPLEIGRVKFCGGKMIRSKAKTRVQVLYCVQACDHPRRYPFGIVESGGIEGGRYGSKETRSKHQVTMPFPSVLPLAA
ncbi:hypothetical protein ARMSODRAFT_981922 [Armillaria solidipes]|uniref:Uncharacterized protein n=1 Tax=Armillaria solidipes TaxID=1076256 RepID=A0A2H3B8V8_9AGAR|nr:hypothetical protein ARMSODRAFT_981922 [Armillaria solidipes]